MSGSMLSLFSIQSAQIPKASLACFRAPHSTDWAASDIGSMADIKLKEVDFSLRCGT